MKTSTGKKVLIIGSGWEQWSLVETIRNAGHQIIATHPDIHADGFRISDQYYVKDSRDIAGHLAIAQAQQIDAVITDNCDYSLYTAAVVASKLKLPFAGIRQALYSNDKYSQRQAVISSGVQQPTFASIRTPEDLDKAVSQIGFPSILKPVDSRGTIGVTIIQNLADLHLAYYDAINNSPSRSLILEKFIEGTLVTVDGFCFSNGHRSLTVASRKFDAGPKPVTKEIIYPAIFTETLNQDLMHAHQKVVNALGYCFGHTHGEYIVTPDEQIYLVECTNRGGGVYTSSVIVPLLTDIPLNEILLNQCLGIDTYQAEELSTGFMKRSVMLTFLDYQVGRVIDHINADQMRTRDYTVRFRSKYGENDMVESIDSGAGRHSMLVIRGENREEVYRNLAAFRNDLKIVYHS
jgi:biotin carboxylase